MRLRSDIAWIGLLWAAAVAFFAPLLFAGKTFYFRDTGIWYQPQAALTRAAHLEGELPLWEPAIGLGYPFQSDPHSMVFYPPAALLSLMPLALGYKLLVTVHAPLAATFTFLLLRRWQMSGPAAVLGALAYAFCGFTVTTLTLNPLLFGLTWIPLALFSFDGFLARGGWAPLAATGLVIGIQGAAAEPLYVVFTCLLLALSPWLRPMPRETGLWKLAAGVAVSSLLAGGLLAYQYLPLAVLVSESDRAAGVQGAVQTAFAVPPAAVANLVLPLAFPDPQDLFFLGSFPDAKPPFLLDLYFGFPLLALALAGAGRCPGQPETRRASRISMALAFLGLAFAVGSRLPLFEGINTVIPLLKLSRFPAKYFVLTAVALSLAAAIGFQRLWSRQEECADSLRFWLVAGAGAALAALAALSSTGSSIAAWFLGGGEGLPGKPGELAGALTTAWGANLLGVCGSCVLMLAMLEAGRRGGPRAYRVAIGAIGVMAAGDVMATTSRSYAAAPDEVVWKKPGPAAVLEKYRPDGTPARFVLVGSRVNEVLRHVSISEHILAGWEQMGYMAGARFGIGNLFQTMAVQLLGLQILEAHYTRANEQERRLLAHAAGARFVLQLGDPLFPEGRKEVIARAGIVSIRDLGDPGPHAYIAPRAIGSSVEAERPATLTLGELPGTAVFRDPALAPGTYARFGPARVKSCQLVSYGRTGLDVEFDLEGEGLLVVKDYFYPGWKAKVDGRQREVVKVAGLLRGVRVRGGEKRLEMRYEPTPFYAGAAISLSTLAAITLAALAGLVRRRLYWADLASSSTSFS